ncbi:hypothetical protein J2X72_004284 [Phyllobacterium sp. 1468]|nr:hypothetical protein [Phyllobacterium sp. 1468]
MVSTPNSGGSCLSLGTSIQSIFGPSNRLDAVPSFICLTQSHLTVAHQARTDGLLKGLLPIQNRTWEVLAWTLW